MKVLLSIFLFFSLVSCINQNKINVKNDISIDQTVIESSVVADTVVWVDTLLDNKFLKLFSISEDDYEDVYAIWGNKTTKHSGRYTRDSLWKTKNPSIEDHWTTERTICILTGCGQSCLYGIFFSSDNYHPIIVGPSLIFYPKISFFDFTTDNYDLYLTSGNLPSVVLNSVDTEFKDSIHLTEDWVRGIGSVYHNIDQVIIKNNQVEIIQKEDGIIVRKKVHHFSY